MIGSYFILKKKLNGDYLDRFNYIERFGSRLQIPQEILAEKMMDLIDLMLQAQENETPVENITGKNTDTFCQNFYSDITETDKIKKPFLSFMSIVFLTFTISLLCIMNDPGKERYFNFKDNTFLSSIFAGAYIASVTGFISDIITLMTGSYSEPKKIRKIHTAHLIFTLILTVIIISFAAAKDLIIIFPASGALIVSAVFLIFYYSASLIVRYKTTGSLRKNKNEYMMSFGKFAEAESEEQSLKQYKKVVEIHAQKYKRSALRYMKKRGKKLTTEMHFKKLNRISVISLLTGALSGMIISIGILSIKKLLTFDSPADQIFFYSIMCVMFTGIIFLILSLTKPVRKTMDRILAECRKLNVEVDEYSDILSGSSDK